MRTRMRIRPSKPASAVGMIVGAIFVGIGFFVAIPHAGPFGILWTLIPLAITGYHALNVFSDRGVADRVIDYETSPQPDIIEPGPESLEERLARLDRLKRKGLLNNREYEEQRRKILDEL